MCIAQEAYLFFSSDIHTLYSTYTVRIVAPSWDIKENIPVAKTQLGKLIRETDIYKEPKENSESERYQVKINPLVESIKEIVNLKVNLLDFTNLKNHTEREIWKASKLRSNGSGPLWLCNHSLKRERDRGNGTAYLRYDDRNFLRFGQEI